MKHALLLLWLLSLSSFAEEFDPLTEESGPLTEELLVETTGLPEATSTTPIELRLSPDYYARLNEFERTGDAALQVELEHELELAQSFPDPRGSYLLELDSEAIAGSQTRVIQRYTVANPIVPGGGFLVASHFRHVIPFQFTEPTEANYLSITSDNPEARFAVKYVARKGIHGGLNVKAEMPFFELVEGELQPGERVSIDLGGSTGIDLPEQALSAFELPLYIKFDADAPIAWVPGPSLQILPGTPARFFLTSSSLVAAGEPVRTTLRIEDQFGNLTSSRNMNLDLLVNGVFRQRLRTAENPSEIDNIFFELPGEYYLEVRSGGGGLRARSNPVVVRERVPFEIMWAVYGQHTNLSDDLPTASDLEAANVGKFDLILRSENSDYFETPPVIEFDGVRISNSTSPVNLGGSYDLVSYGATDLLVAMAENPTDLRALPHPPALVYVLTPESSYGWMFNEIASRGYRVGVIGSNQTHQFPLHQKLISTAVLKKPGETWFEAFHARRTYVTSNHRTVLLTSVNNVPQGGRTPLAETRTVKAEVYSGSGVASVDLYKNARLLRSFTPPMTEEYLLSLDLFSSSKPFSNTQSLPRNAREWIGYLMVRGARISLRGQNNDFELRASPDSRRIDFLTRTHGNTQSLTFELDSMDPDTVVEVNLASGYEDAAWIPEDRLPSETPAMKFPIPLAEITSMNAVRRIETSGYMDELTLRQIPEEMPDSLEVSYTDDSAPRIGDYYYIRVTHGDGSQTWSSPIYVGGSDEY